MNTQWTSGFAVVLALSWAAAPGQDLVANGAAESARERLAEVQALRRSDLPAARAAVVEAIAELEAVLPDGIGLSGLDAMRQLCYEALAVGELATARRGLAATLAIEVEQRPPGNTALQQTRLLLSMTHAALEDLPGAVALLEQVLSEWEPVLTPEDREFRNLCVARSNLAQYLARLGNLQRAVAILRAAVADPDTRRALREIDLAIARNNLAGALFEMGDSVAARTQYEEALQIFERLLPADHDRVLRVQANLAMALLTSGEFETGRRITERVFAELRRKYPADHPRVQTCRLNLGLVLMNMHEFAAARDHFAAVHEIRAATMPEHRPALQLARMHLGDALNCLGEVDRALELHRQVVTARERDLPPDHPHLINARLALAATTSHAGDGAATEAQLAALVAGLGTGARSWLLLGKRERGAWIRSAITAIDLVLQYDVGAELERATFELMETLRALATSAPRPSAEPADAELTALEEAARAARGRVGALVATLGGTAERPARQDIAAAIEQRDAADRRLLAALVESGRIRFPEITVGAIAARLPDGAAAVAYHRRYVGGNRYVAHVVRRDGSLVRIDLGPAPEIDRAIEDFRSSVGAPLRDATEAKPADPDAAAEAVVALVLDPVLAAAKTEALYLCLDDALHVVPWQALPRGGAPLRTSLELRLLNSFAELLDTMSNKPGPPRMLALGGADFGAGPGASEPAARRFAPLPGGGAEVSAVAQQFKAQFGAEAGLVVLQGVDASKAALAAGATASRFLHLSTHGYFQTDLPSWRDPLPGGAQWEPMSASRAVSGLAPAALVGLALSGANRGPDPTGRHPGILTAEEIAGLDLRGCELAVLSACETNVGLRSAGQGIQSMQAAFHAAGVRTTISSLWPVPAEPTRMLMRAFYENLWAHGRSKAEALRRAQETLREQRYPMRAWAGWVLTGDPR